MRLQSGLSSTVFEGPNERGLSRRLMAQKDDLELGPTSSSVDNTLEVRSHLRPLFPGALWKICQRIVLDLDLLQAWYLQEASWERLEMVVLQHQDLDRVWTSCRVGRKGGRAV